MDYTELISQLYENQELTPGLAKQLQSSKRLADKQRLYNISLRDSHFLSKKLERDSIIDKAKWSITDTTSSEYVNERLGQLLNNNLLKSIHESNYKGISVHEIIYDGKKINNIVDIPMNLLNYKRDLATGNHLIYKLDNNKQYLIDNEKIIVSTSNVYINYFPIGLSEIAANLLVLKYITMYKQIPKFNESVAIPSLWAYYQNEQQKNDAMNALINIGRNARGVIPDGCRIEWLEAKNSDTATFFNTIKSCEDNISRLVTGVVNSGENGTGSYSALESQISIKEDLASNSLDIVSDAINTYLIPRICEEINSIDYPIFRLTLPNKKSIDVDKILAETMGVKFTAKYLMDNYGLSIDDFTLGV